MSPLAAMEILRAAVERCSAGPVKTLEVRKALRRVQMYCRERWPLDMFWDAADAENEIGRAQSLNAAFNAIAVQVGLPRWVSDRQDADQPRGL
jgi:hypothetical protein